MLSALPLGKASAVTLKVLVEKTGLSARDCQASIEALRAEGVPVCSGSDGYYLAGSPDEALEFEQTQAHRIRAMLRSLRGVRRWRRRVEGSGQMGIWA